MRKPVRLILAVATLAAATISHALEQRTWTSLDGRTLEAELVRADAEKVDLKDKTGRTFTVKRAQLSKADQDYLTEMAPKTGSLPFSGEKKPGAVPNPAKEAKIDTKTFVKRTEVFKMEKPAHEFFVLETPHFLILHPEKVDAKDVGELAERVWLDMNFFHPTFGQKFKDRRMAVFLAGDEETYNDIGMWYAEMVASTGNGLGNDQAAEAAGRIKATWPQSAAGGVRLSQDLVDKYQVLSLARVFRNYQKEGSGKEKEIKGVWIPFRVHCLASDMVGIQAGGVSDFGAKGYHALTLGHAYFKEIQLTGRSETSILNATGTDNKVGSTGGFQNAKNWPDELKKLIRRKDLTPTLGEIYKLTAANGTPGTNVLAYSFARFLQSTPDRIAMWAKLLEQIDTASQVPEANDLAKALGYTDANALEAAWAEWLRSSEFR